VDGDTAIDARGRNPLRLVRQGADRIREVSAAELIEVLRTEATDGRVLVERIAEREMTDAAARTAEYMLRSLGR